jgi:ABC-2 type transport system permease protein
MRNVTTLTQRELSVFFFSPIAYVVLAVFLGITGAFFVTDNFQPGADASLRVTFGNYLPVILMFVMPLLTMRLLADEFRGGTIETLMTAPVSDVDVILGKFLGTMVFYVVMLATTLLYVVLVAAYGPLDVGLVLCNYFGLVLVGGLFIAVGLFFSACTRSQVVAGLCTLVLLAVITLLANYLAQNLEGTLRVLLQHLSVLAHFQDFSRGLVDTNHLIFFVTTTALFLFLAVKVLESRRWR